MSTDTRDPYADRERIFEEERGWRHIADRECCPLDVLYVGADDLDAPGVTPDGFAWPTVGWHDEDGEDGFCLLCTTHARVLDHRGLWLDQDGRRIFTFEPYDTDGESLVAFITDAAAHGLRVMVTGASGYYPGHTYLGIVDQAPCRRRASGPRRSVSST
jgi:hypothetical protein